MKYFLTVVLVIFTTVVWGAETLKKSDLDTEVTDIKLRANSGAKSKFSTSFYVNYSGASLTKPGGDERPNVGDGRVASPVSISGNVGLRYRKNKNESIFVATGMSRERPFHSRENGEQLEVSTPHLGYNKTYALDDTQISSSFRLYITTLDRMREIGEVATFGYSLSAMNDLGHSRFSGGIGLNTWVVGYDKNTGVFPTGPSSEVQIQEMQNDYGISLTPSLQYNKTGRVNIYTSLSLFNYSHYRSDPAFKFDEGNVTQTVGVGAAIVRDFYLSPYVSFEPEKISSDRTSVNLNATINL